MKSGELVKRPTLLELTASVESILEALDASPDDSALADALANAGGALAAKVDGYCAVTRELQGRATLIKDEILRLEGLAKACMTAVDRLKGAARLASVKMGVSRLKGTRGEIVVSRVDKDAMDILDQAKVPMKFQDEVITHKVNRERLAKGIVLDEATGTVADRQTGEDLSLAVRVRPVFAVRFK